MNTITIALSGLEAASKRLQASASNIANLQTTGSLQDGGQAPYAPQMVVQETQTDSQGNSSGVRSNIIPRSSPFVPAYDPDSPFADENGVIGVSNIDLTAEAVNMKLAELNFKANVEVIKAAEENTEQLLDIFDDE